MICSTCQSFIDLCSFLHFLVWRRGHEERIFISAIACSGVHGRTTFLWTPSTRPPVQVDWAAVGGIWTFGAFILLHAISVLLLLLTGKWLCFLDILLASFRPMLRRVRIFARMSLFFKRLLNNSGGDRLEHWRIMQLLQNIRSPPDILHSGTPVDWQ